MCFLYKIARVFQKSRLHIKILHYLTCGAFFPVIFCVLDYPTDVVHGYEIFFFHESGYVSCHGASSLSMDSYYVFASFRDFYFYCLHHVVNH